MEERGKRSEANQTLGSEIGDAALSMTDLLAQISKARDRHFAEERASLGPCPSIQAIRAQRPQGHRPQGRRQQPQQRQQQRRSSSGAGVQRRSRSAAALPTAKAAVGAPSPSGIFDLTRLSAPKSQPHRPASPATQVTLSPSHAGSGVTSCGLQRAASCTAATSHPASSPARGAVEASRQADRTGSAQAAAVLSRPPSSKASSRPSSAGSASTRGYAAQFTRRDLIPGPERPVNVTRLRPASAQGRACAQACSTLQAWPSHWSSKARVTSAGRTDRPL